MPLWTLTLAATGVVFGDIGTSPLYTWNEIRNHGGVETTADAMGVTSLILWVLSVTITAKYVTFVLRADNNGEGGTFALMGLLQALRIPRTALFSSALVMGSCLLFGEGLLTPAISVLSAVEGLTVRNPALAPVVVPLTLAILAFVFRVQSLGTARVGGTFGTIMIAWFLAIGALGLREVLGHPEILGAFNPYYAFTYVVTHGPHGTAIALASVILCITGGEALYADLGHFGAQAIRRAWLVLAYPCLMLSYMGQGARLASGGPIVANNVFFSLVPEWAVYPMVGLATLAAIIASQALISGAFSLARSAINLGLLPRVTIVHTNEAVEGQIYMPAINLLLWAGCSLLVITFGSSTGLAAAYGFTMSGTMVATTSGMAMLARYGWGWSLPRLAATFGPFLLLELAYLTSTSLKFFDGAWMSAAFGIGLYTFMRTWRSTRSELGAAYRAVDRITVRELVARKSRLTELPRAMVFLTSERIDEIDDPVPVLLLKFMDRYGSLPKHLTVFNVVFVEDRPYWTGERYETHEFGEHIVSVRMFIGYMESPNVRRALWQLRHDKRIRIHSSRWTIVMGKEAIVIDGGAWWWRARYYIFSLALATAAQAQTWFGLGADTGVSKEVVPVRVTPKKGMEVTIRLED